MADGYIGDFPTNASFHKLWDSWASGVLMEPVGLTLAAYKNNDATQTTTGVTVTDLSHDGISGLLLISLVCTDAFYAAGSEISIIATAGTLEGASLVGRIFFSFSIERTGGALAVAKARLPTSLVSGRIDAHVGSVADAVITAAKFAANALDAVWSTSSRTLTAFSTGLAVSVWDVLASAVAASSSIGLQLKTNVDAAISTRASQTSVDTIDDFVDSEVSAIKAKTDQLVFTTANRLDSTVVDKTGFALSSAGNNAVRDAVTGDVIETEGNITLQAALSIILAVIAGESEDGGLTFRTPNGNAIRVQSVVNVSNERTAQTLTPSS